MHQVNQTAVPMEHRKSPQGSFEIFRQHVSVALGGVRSIGPWGGGHPFEVERARIPAGKKGYPYHAHAAQTEYYVVLTGTGTVTDESDKDTRSNPGIISSFIPAKRIRSPMIPPPTWSIWSSPTTTGPM